MNLGQISIKNLIDINNFAIYIQSFEIMNELHIELHCVPSSIAQKNQSQVTRQLLKTKTDNNRIQLGQFHSFSFSEYRTISITQYVHQSHGQTAANALCAVWMGWMGRRRQCVPKEIQLKQIQISVEVRSGTSHMPKKKRLASLLFCHALGRTSGQRHQVVFVLHSLFFASASTATEMVRTDRRSDRRADERMA